METTPKAAFGAEFLDGLQESCSGGGSGGWTCWKDIETGAMTCTNGKIIKFT